MRYVIGEILDMLVIDSIKQASVMFATSIASLLSINQYIGTHEGLFDYVISVLFRNNGFLFKTTGLKSLEMNYSITFDVPLNGHHVNQIL